MACYLGKMKLQNISGYMTMNQQSGHSLLMWPYQIIWFGINFLVVLSLKCFFWNLYDQALIWRWLFDSVGDSCGVTWVTDNCFCLYVLHNGAILWISLQGSFCGSGVMIEFIYCREAFKCQICYLKHPVNVSVDKFLLKI